MAPNSCKVFLAPVDGTELVDLLPARARQSFHSLTDDPAAADLILLLGSFGQEPGFLLDHPLYRAHPEKCAVYTEDDYYLPLAPGVYCSARRDDSTRIGRVSTFSYVCASGGRCSNPFVAAQAVPKEFLFSFQGGSTSLVRKRLFNRRFDRPDVLIENTNGYNHWVLDEPGREEQQRRYARTVAASHFVLCPRGAGTASIRLFEVMQAGIAPVLLSDDYVLPPQVPWDTFLLRFSERDVPRLPELIEPHLATSAERGRLARAAWLAHFAPDQEFDGIVSGCLAALRHGHPDEAIFRRQQGRLIARTIRRRRWRAFARNVVLGALRLLRLRSPYQINR